MNPIETKDLIIRDSVFEDLKYFDPWERQPAVTEFFSIADGQSLEDVTKAYVKFDEAADMRQYTICLRKSGEPVGRIILGDIIEGWKCEIWRIYIADTALRGKGYGRQAMEATMKLCFEDFGMKRVYLDHQYGKSSGAPVSESGISVRGRAAKELQEEWSALRRASDVHAGRGIL